MHGSIILGARSSPPAACSLQTRAVPRAGPLTLLRASRAGLHTDDPFEGGGVTVWDGAPQGTYHYKVQAARALS